MSVRHSLFTAIFFLSSLLGIAWAQSPKPTTLLDLAKYTGADRGRVLYDGAKKEGKFLWYTSLIANKEIVKIFESKYPGVTVETYRASGTQLASRVLAEAQSKRYLGDVIETSPPGLMVLRDSQLLLPYTSPYLSEYPEAAKQKAPRGLVFWTTDRESYIGVGYNKNVLPAADVPKNFDDLLKPALRGKMAISNDDVAARLVGGMIKSKGEAFVRKLKDQDVKVHGVSGPGFNELIVSGEVADIVYRYSQQYWSCGRQGRASGMGSHGSGAQHLRRHCALLPRPTSLRRIVVGRFSSQSRRTENANRDV